MFSITIAVGNVSWRLLYKGIGDATIAAEKLQSAKDGVVEIIDDFGQLCSINVKSFHGLLLEDLEKMKMAHVETALHNARLQAMANKAAQADPGLRASAMSSSPGVLTPMNSFRPS